MRKIFHLLIFIFVFLFFWNTDIANHTEADDAFEYAQQVESLDHPWLYHPHHLAYGVLAKKAYRALVSIGYPHDAYNFLVLMSSLCAAGAVFLFYRFCYRRYSMRPISSLFAAGFLTLSYGFWRYACEAEIILPAAFLVLSAAYLATASESTPLKVAFAAFVAAGSVLIHIMNAVPVFAAIPLFYILNRKTRYAVYHFLIAGLLVAIAYIWVYSFRPSLALSTTTGPLMGRLEWSLFVKGAVGFGQCLVSGNFLFGYDAFVNKMVSVFPSRMLAEEIYMGQAMNAAHRVVASITGIILLGLIIFTLIHAIKAWGRAIKSERTKALMMVGGWQTLAVVALWFLVYALAILLLEPGNPEVWVLGLVPFWLLVCGLVIAPIARANELWIVLLLLLVLGLHNYVGGIGVLKNPESDYNKQKAGWVLEHATPDDLILTAENPVFIRYLVYHTAADVLDLNSCQQEDMQRSIRDTDRVFILDDVFNYPRSMKVRFPGNAEKVNLRGLELKPHSTQLIDNEFGGVWEFVRKVDQ